MIREIIIQDTLFTFTIHSLHFVYLFIRVIEPHFDYPRKKKTIFSLSVTWVLSVLCGSAGKEFLFENCDEKLFLFSKVTHG